MISYAYSLVCLVTAKAQGIQSYSISMSFYFKSYTFVPIKNTASNRAIVIDLASLLTWNGGRCSSHTEFLQERKHQKIVLPSSSQLWDKASGRNSTPLFLFLTTKRGIASRSERALLHESRVTTRLSLVVTHLHVTRLSLVVTHLHYTHLGGGFVPAQSFVLAQY